MYLEYDRNFVRLGETKTGDAGQDFAIEEVTPHPNYDTPKFANDVALIRLARVAELCMFLSKIQMMVVVYDLSMHITLVDTFLVILYTKAQTAPVWTSFAEMHNDITLSDQIQLFCYSSRLTNN